MRYIVIGHQAPEKRLQALAVPFGLDRLQPLLQPRMILLAEGRGPLLLVKAVLR
jgi:hypothetical protein